MANKIKTATVRMIKIDGVLTKQEVHAANSGIEAPWALDIAKGDDVELRLASTARCIDGEEDGPGDDAAYSADNNAHPVHVSGRNLRS
jgi:hypothetical protein